MKYSAFLFGPRGTGKTMLSRTFAGEIGAPPDAYFDLLDGDLTRRDTTSPHSFYHDVEYLLGSPSSQTSPLLVVIDEVQKLPALLDEVHALIEAHKGAVQFLLTGSSARKLKRPGVNLLAGRAISLHLQPFQVWIPTFTSNGLSNLEHPRLSISTREM